MRAWRMFLAGITAGLWMSATNVWAGEESRRLPEFLQEQSFVYDELETGEGSDLYTLEFTETGYRLYQDGGFGIISEGTVTVSGENKLIFQEETGDEADSWEGSYEGNAFSTPEVNLYYGEKVMKFETGVKNEEDVYLHYLGVYESPGGKAILILDRWKEFYIWDGKELLRGTFEIYQDGTAVFTSTEGEIQQAYVKKTGEGDFEIQETVFDIQGEQFSWAEASAVYKAEHAMGAYTLSCYDLNVFAIRGADGFVKAMGTLQTEEEEGTVSYFPRMITDEAELGKGFSVKFANKNGELIFPDTTPLLPRSGNMDEKTGKGSYWQAGTTLEFIKSKEKKMRAVDWDPREINLKEIPIRAVSAAGKASFSQVMPSIGKAKPLVLLIDFPDYKRPRFVEASDMEEALFSLENQDSLAAYYYRSSYGNLTIDGTVLDWYRMEKERDAYETDREVIEEALGYYIEEKGLRLADYDADEDGVVDSLFVLWAGNLDDESGIWSAAYRSSWNSSPEEWGTKITGYIFVPGTTVWSSVPPLICNTNSLTHETGHLLGLNDYYSYDTSDRTDGGEAYTGGALEGGLGGMDMMDSNTGEHNAFSKWLLGFLDPEVLEYDEIFTLKDREKEYRLRPSNEQGDAIFIKLRDDDTLFTELLVIEAVSPTMNAGELTRLEEPAVRILHVDASLQEEGQEGNWRGYGFRNDNSYTSTKFISILEADGKDEILNYLPSDAGNKVSYDPEDYYREGDRITPNTWPGTNGYDIYGNATVFNGLTIWIEEISPDGEALIRLGYEEEENKLSVAEVSPSPRIVPYTGEAICIPADTREITVTYDQEIEPAEEGSLKQVIAVSGNDRLEEYDVMIQGKELKIQFAEPLGENRDCTIIIPADTVRGKENKAKGNFNSIWGFATENQNKQKEGEME